jgi:hypothetical protein
MPHVAVHANLPAAEKLRLLKRAKAILCAGYRIAVMERNVKLHIETLRLWARELDFDLNRPKVKR